MKRSTWLILALLFAATACDDGSNVPLDAATDAVADADGQPPQDAADDQPAPDTIGPEATPDAAKEQEEPDLVFPDIIPDTTPPKVASTVPAAESTGVQVPFEVRITFSEAIRFKETVDKNTFQVKDMNGKLLAGKLTYDDKTYTVTWTPDAAVVFMLASPYKVTLTTIIQDAVGNHLEEPFNLSFSTALPKGAEAYEALAGKYSPIIYQSTSKTAPNLDYLTAFDFDGNWAALDNEAAIKKAAEVPSWVYYDVVESKTHYFVRFVYFWPFHAGVKGDNTDAFSNDVVGATVVVEKRPTERPIAVMTYIGLGAFEEVRTYASKESGLVTAKGKNWHRVNWEFPEAELFPAGHYQAYLTAQSHQSCLWNHTTKEATFDSWCVLNEGLKKQLSIIRYAYDGTATAIKKQNGSWPATLAADVGYGLRSLMADWWAKRDHVGEQSMFSTTFTYGDCADCEGLPDLPGKGMILPNAFLDSVFPEGSLKGRPPWAWVWNDTVNTDIDIYPMPRGAYYLDPIHFFAKKHRIEVGMNPETKAGFSDRYCYNPYLLIDQRDKDPDCK
ncbi:MAG: Ig-like domain-containing protein [Deltaproteobacteria bacterium]|nr:Ig-like domain-containing protein [Deltaproteobacteria bacterium]